MTANPILGLHKPHLTHCEFPLRSNRADMARSAPVWPQSAHTVDARTAGAADATPQGPRILGRVSPAEVLFLWPPGARGGRRGGGRWAVGGGRWVVGRGGEAAKTGRVTRHLPFRRHRPQLPLLSPPPLPGPTAQWPPGGGEKTTRLRAAQRPEMAPLRPQRRRQLDITIPRCLRRGEISSCHAATAVFVRR